MITIVITFTLTMYLPDLPFHTPPPKLSTPSDLCKQAKTGTHPSDDVYGYESYVRPTSIFLNISAGKGRNNIPESSVRA